MAWRNYREDSRKQWGSSQEEPLTIEQINCGAMLRIADALEKLTPNVMNLINENVRLQQQNETLIRSRRALQGINRRLKSKATVA